MKEEYEKKIPENDNFEEDQYVIARFIPDRQSWIQPQRPKERVRATDVREYR